MEEKNSLQESISDLEAAKKLIAAVKMQFEKENEKIMEFKKEMYRANDFKVNRFAFFDGPNFYLNKKAMVFNVYIAPVGDTVGFFKDEISKVIPSIAESNAEFVVDLFAEVLLEVMRMDIRLFLNDYSISRDDDEYVIAMEFFDKKVAKQCAYFVSDMFYAISNDKPFNIQKGWEELQAQFDKSLFGGPTIYSLIEAGLKRNIPVFYIFEENQFQWGYGIKQLRGRSTTFHNDGIKDTEFTMYKDMCGDFLEMCGFPTPKAINTFTVEDAVEAAGQIGYPCVVKPVNGHKGQGVTTGVQNEAQVSEAFQKIIQIGEENAVPFAGALVQTQIYGTDHRLLAVGGQFVAALERVPAFVEGDGIHTIEELIVEENKKEIRLDNARSPLCKIKIDDDLKGFLALQNKSLQDVPFQGEHVVLRRVANISAGGVSINVTDNIHPDNIRMVEDIASFLTVRNLGIDVLAADISKSWKEGSFGIIEINAGPGVFMHLAPAYGGSIDVPGKIILSHFGEPKNSRIPVISANHLSNQVAIGINDCLHQISEKAHFGCLLEDGVYFNNVHLTKNPDHLQNQKIILRHPKTDFALFTHNNDEIYDFGLLYEGADMVILDNPAPAEEKVLKAQLLPEGILIDSFDGKTEVFFNGELKDTYYYNSVEEKEAQYIRIVEQYILKLYEKYH